MTKHAHLTVLQPDVDEFLAGHRIAVIGASDEHDNFARTIYRELKSHGYEAIAVHPTATTVDGDPAFAHIDAVPAPVDGAIVMVPSDAAATVVQECVDAGVTHVWLFRGLGGDGAVSPDAVRLCTERGVDVVAGACPLMFLEPVGWFHRMHRAGRHHSGSLVDAD